MFGAGLGAGLKPGQAAAAGALAGLASGMIKPSQAVVQNMSGEVPLAEPITQPDGTLAPAPGSRGVMPDGRPATYEINRDTGFMELRPVAGSYQVRNGVSEFVPQQPGIMQALQSGPLGGVLGGGQAGAGGQGGGLGGLLSNPAALLAGAAALSSMRSAPAQAQQAVSTLSPAQQEYFNRPSVTWDWNKMQRDAAMSGMNLGQYMATNWPRITSGQYNTPTMAHGGALSAVARFARGAGTGRSDEIDAKLSDGEYVIDAETVAMLGDGSSKAGAQRLDQMREAIRSHKGKALAKGKFSPDAKSPLSYLKGAA
jgi:hypothetical protein